jgi:hypothetical protein
MAHPELPDSAGVHIDLKVSEVDAARIDDVVTRPEFAGWTRDEWCVEIIRTALRYYVGEDPADAPDQKETADQLVAGQGGTPAPPSANQAGRAATLADASSQDAPDNGSEPRPPAPESAAQPQSEPRIEPAARAECVHPAGARNYETGTCTACGAILWD